MLVHLRPVTGLYLMTDNYGQNVIITYIKTNTNSITQYCLWNNSYLLIYDIYMNGYKCVLV